MGGAALARGHGGPRRRHVKGLLTRNATTSTRAVPERVRLRTMASMERADANPRPPIASAKDFGQVCSLDSQRAARARACVRPLTPHRARARRSWCLSATRCDPPARAPPATAAARRCPALSCVTRPSLCISRAERAAHAIATLRAPAAVCNG